ncbi:hypothetical protein RclHR1_00810024 [Rhizophagus clarus]|uniref:SET domain-containing protein n=1 Tax=Rhizophagus clarus TaxID=94130 RepID=A0A2Z6SF18_9GLOM|nr:hypothetical protein RclHR1_00810024 [Rhizophagus clarus]GES95277.1 hypothetical protein GLOIN_2v1154509 [Rhizophagus clarus]
MFIKKLPYICQQMRKKEYDISSSEKFMNEKLPLNDKPKIPAVYVFQRAQGDFTLISKHKFQKFQYILHHTCTSSTTATTCHTKKSCEHFFNDNIKKSDLYYDICSGIESSQSKLSCFIKFSKNPNCFLVKKYINKELNLGLYALRDIYEGDELSICNNIDNLFEIFNEFNFLFPKELDPFKINLLRSLYLEKLIEKLNINDLDNFELNSLDISLEERNFLNNHPNLISITQTLEYSILSHFSSSNIYPSKLFYSLKSKNNSNKITLVSLTKTTLKLFNLPNDYYNQIYLILSLEHFNVTLSQKLSMLLNTYRLFLLWINCEHKFTYVSRIEQFIICYVISINSLMESWISINDWAKLLMSIGVSIGDCENVVSDVVKSEKFIERFKWLQLRCLECVEYKCMVTLCAHYKFLNEVCDKFKINKLL